MSQILLSFALILPGLDEESTAPPAVNDKPALAEEPKRSKLNKKGEPSESPSLPNRFEEDESAPVPDDDRPIPKPTDVVPADDLDELLQRDLGQDLEAKQVEDEDPISRITGRMRESEELLARAEEEKRSIELQEQIVKDLAQLLEEMQNQGDNSQQQQRMQQRKQRLPLDPQQLARQKAQMRKQMTQSRNREPADRIGPPASAREKLSPQPEERAVWGHLSEMLRAEMSQYAKDQFLPKYREMIERYYTDIASKSGERGD